MVAVACGDWGAVCSGEAARARVRAAALEKIRDSREHCRHSLADSLGRPIRLEFDDRERWATNLTFYPSEFSKLRLQWNRDRSEALDDVFSTVLLQFEFLYGAHGGHKF